MSSVINQIGFYYFPDDLHYTQADLRAWLPILKQLRANWVTLQAGHDRAIPEEFLRSLIEARIQPIIHIPARVGEINPPALHPVLASYRDWGVEDIVVFDRPNMRAGWETLSWNQTGLIDRFVDNLLPIWEIYKDLGLRIFFPPLEPGGDYWDTAFLESSLDVIARRGASEYLEEAAIALYSFTGDRPLEWGSGGPDRWPEARPYHTPEGCQDQIGFRIFEWYAAISERILGYALPMLAIAGGASPQSNPTLGEVDSHAEINAAILRYLEDEKTKNLQSFCFYLLSADPDSTEASSAWFRAPDDPIPVVDEFSRVLQSIQKSSKSRKEKPISHYVLLPMTSRRNATQDWMNLAPFALSLRPVVGFSPSEARLAEQVTIIADKMSIPPTIDDMLIEAGCEVRRFEGNQEELLVAASELAASTLSGDSNA